MLTSEHPSEKIFQRTSYVTLWNYLQKCEWRRRGSLYLVVRTKSVLLEGPSELTP